MRSPLSRLILPIVALSMAVLLPVRAAAQAQPPEGGDTKCFIENRSGKDARCTATLCGPIGNYTYVWESRVKGFPGGNTQCITVSESGTYTLTLLDPATGKILARCSQAVFIEKCTQNRPPDCSGAHAKNPLLWPPNHDLESVEIEGVTDPDGDPIAITVYSITQDEPLDANGDGATCADGNIEDGQAYVRSERTGDPESPGNGRVYVISFVAVDSRGGKCGGSITVGVPHDMGQSNACVDDGQAYDSLGDCPL